MFWSYGGALLQNAPSGSSFNWNQIFLLLGTAMGGGGVISVFVATRNANKLTAAAQKAESNKTKLDEQKFSFDILKETIKTLRDDNAHDKQVALDVITGKDAVIAEMTKTIKELQKELRAARSRPTRKDLT